MCREQIWDQTTPEESIAAYIDTVKSNPSMRHTLVALLPEQAAIYQGRSTNATIRLRGYLLAAFETIGLPDIALPFVLQELESGLDAYLVAGAAKALRGHPQPSPHFVRYLLQAFENIRYIDDAMTFDSYKPRWPVAHYTTALNELVLTLQWLGPHAHAAIPALHTLRDADHGFANITRQLLSETITTIQADPHCCAGTHTQGTNTHTAQASCCAPSTVPITHLNTQTTTPPNFDQIADIELEDQAAQQLTFGDYFTQKPTVVVFFYTRCTNPNKCSLTVSKLAKLQRLITARALDDQVQTAAITYDPDYDLPPRLKSYGENRNVTYNANHRLLRTRSRFDEVQAYFDLGVNYTSSLVNQHRIELYILDASGQIVKSIAHRQWDIEEVLDAAVAALPHTECQCGCVH